MKKLVALSLGLALTSAACKTSDTPAGSDVKDFDTGANQGLAIPFDDKAAFCPSAKGFNVGNAYWLTLASAYVYASQDRLSEVAQAIKTEWSSLKVDFLSSPDSINPLDPSTQALWIETDNAAVLAFRGTPLDRIDAQDVVSDVKALLVPFADGQQLGKVHKGFRIALDGVWGDVSTRIKALQGTNKPLFVTGHSLGGALATMTVGRVMLLDEFKNVRGNVRGLYTLGSPRVGNAEFVAKVEAARQSAGGFPIVRLRNGQDIVTRVPGVGYQHLGEAWFISPDGRLYTKASDAPGSRYKMTQGVAQTIKEGFVVTQLSDLAEHLPIDYYAKVSHEYRQHKTWVAATQGSACADTGFYTTAAVANVGQTPPVATLADLKARTSGELTKLFATGVAAPIPSADSPGAPADGQGLAIIQAGATVLNDFAANFWEGKIFVTDQSGKTTLNNKLAGALITDISADVYKIDDGLQGDGKPSILLDYSRSNRLSARAIRDEIRRIAPGLYLGRANLENPTWLQPILGRYKFVVWFALGFDEAGQGA